VALSRGKRIIMTIWKKKVKEKLQFENKSLKNEKRTLLIR
jgi:hypothetical protein